MAQVEQKPKIIKPEELSRLRYPLPRSWVHAIGILKGKKVNPLSYQRTIRKGWSARLKKLEP